MKRFFFLFVLGLMLACQPDSVFSDPIIELHPEPAVQEPEPEEYSFVVLGDSYSAYSGSVPSGYLTWYPHSDNNVSELSQMWWSLLEARPGYTMLYNSS